MGPPPKQPVELLAHIWCCGYFQASYTKTISLKAALGRCWLTLLLLMPCQKSPSLSALAQPDVGDCFSPYPCVSLVNSGEAAAASSTSWKLDGSWMEALVPYKQQPRRDRGVTPQAEIPSRPKPPLPARAQHDHGPRSPQGASVCSMPGFPCH